ncbi:MAG: acetyl-CoA hydrolase/transferase C-terminal domain-containing protein [Cycloclasticus sp.]
MKTVSHDSFNFKDYIQPGDHILCGQCTAEPLTLTEKLVRERSELGGCTVFLGAVYSDTFKPEHSDFLSFYSYGGIGKAAVLAKAGVLDQLPHQYSAFSRAFGDGSLRADCVLLQLSKHPVSGKLNFGLSHDYTALAARQARVVIAEINPDVPYCHGADVPDDIKIELLIDAIKPPIEVPSPQSTDVELKIGALVASLIPDQATIQVGVGGIPHAVLSSLKNHRDIGIHSGIVTDGMLDLIEQGVVTNRYKARDQGISLTGNLMGSRRFMDYIDDNPTFSMSPPSDTHGFQRLSRIDNFIAINSAIEIDPLGQINSEVANGVHIGATGGQLDYMRGANASKGGRAIIALPSTARGGSISRIVPALTRVSCPTSEVDAIVTEWGIAELHGCTIKQRIPQIIAIAAPQFRDQLNQAFKQGQYQ